jgi:hypothetical protein
VNLVQKLRVRQITDAEPADQLPAQRRPLPHPDPRAVSPQRNQQSHEIRRHLQLAGVESGLLARRQGKEVCQLEALQRQGDEDITKQLCPTLHQEEVQLHTHLVPESVSVQRDLVGHGEGAVANPAVRFDLGAQNLGPDGVVDQK